MANELVTKSFHAQALAFPSRVDQMLAEVQTVEGRKQLLDQAAVMQQYAKRIKAGIEVEKPIAIGTLKLKAGLGELLPAKPPAERGQGRGGKKSSGATPLDLDGNTLAAYRKLAKHRERIDDYAKSCDDVPTQGGFLSTLTAEQRAKKDREREAKRKAAAKQIAKAATIEQALQAAKFTTICIDPPWDWSDEGDKSQLGRGNTVYGGMTIDQLLAMPIGDYADSDAHLYLWITNRSLPKGFQLLTKWGFRYVTCLTWCKPSFGMGNYFRGASEQILFGVRGQLSLNRKDVGTWFEAPRGPDGHSSKPTAFYELVESCSPGPYLDVFSRRERDGWTCWGGQL